SADVKVRIDFPGVLDTSKRPIDGRHDAGAGGDLLATLIPGSCDDCLEVVRGATPRHQPAKARRGGRGSLSKSRFVPTWFTRAELQGCPFILGIGAAWATPATRRTARSRRSPLLAWPLVLAVALAPFSMLLTPWPLRLAFLASRPAMERLADRVAAGK